MTKRLKGLLSRPVQYLGGVGPRRAERFERLGVLTVRDLLYHVPHRYEDATTVAPIVSLKPGDDVSVIGHVVSKGVLPTRKGLRIFHAVLKDDTGLIECAWPGQPWLDRSIGKGDVLLVSGVVHFYHGKQLRPREFTLLSEAAEGERAGLVFPVYSATDGLTHRQIRAIIEANLDAMLAEVADRELFEPEWRADLGLSPLAEALEVLHRPRRLADVEAARRRLAYEELFFLQLLHARARARMRTERPGVAMAAAPGLTKKFLHSLPFTLTEAQRAVWEEIRRDMESAVRMYRLVQGDVGSGKTVVAAAAMLKAVENGRQAVLMAPTELLTEQHFRTLSDLMSPVDITPSILTGSMSEAERRPVLQAMRVGEAQVVVGTHALIQKGVEFANPGLAVIDEQHRFGVEQRRVLRDAHAASDTLVMSATPIPRSVALTLYGDLDLSVIDELPPGRRRVITGVRGPESRDAAFEFARKKVVEGRQAYVVYPLIDESESLDARAATIEHDELSARFPDLAIGLLHGRLPAAEKEAVMKAFIAGRLDILVSTTVIEVGIDVPNATLMLIEHAERFGLAQLHQLRGRVGRGADQSYCVAFYSGSAVPERLRIFAATDDGFELARADLRLRGAGNLFGSEQHGLPRLRFSDPELDVDLLVHARLRAQALVERDPDLGRPAHRAFARELAERYADHQALFGIG